MKAVAVAVAAAILISLVAIKFIIPLVLLALGHGVETPLPRTWVRILPTSVTLVASVLAGPLFIVMILAVVWFLLRK